MLLFFLTGETLLSKHVLVARFLLAGGLVLHVVGNPESARRGVGMGETAGAAP